MAFLDFLTKDIEEQERIANEAARSRFNPNRLNPQLEQASRVAREGIADEELRAKVLDSILNQGNVTTENVSREFGSGRALSFLENLNQQRGQQIGQAETNIALREEQARREGEAREAEVRTKQRQLADQRDARIKRNRLMAEAQASARKKQFLGKLGGFALSAVGGAPAIGSALGINLGGASVNEGAVLEEIAKMSVGNPEPEPDIIAPDINTSLDSHEKFMDDLMKGNLGF